ncbi:MAG: vanadium-dependent haloperoxidase [Candidatus Limnocylindria bacterium]
MSGAVLVALALSLPACAPSQPWVDEGCTREDADGHSVARVWDEQLLALIRQVVPAPTVHARNLFHVSAAMWDAWAAYEPDADGYFVAEKMEAEDVAAAREAAISFAAYRILHWRYAEIGALDEAPAQLDATMASLCYRPDFTDASGDGPAALGNRIAATVIEAGANDGALEEDRYVDASYTARNDPLEVDDPGTRMRDPSHWQPLSIGEQISQNGIPIPGNIQSYIGPHWGRVTGFALAASDEGLPIDPGAPPMLGDPAGDADFKQEAIDNILASSQLDPADGVTIDIGPGAVGNNSLGANDGRGYEANPATGQSYAPNRVLRADFARVLTEYWADGPTSETPPGHWNVIANEVSDSPDIEHRLGGEGPELDRLEWDVKVYFALNGAVHDAAIAAWGAKRAYESARPISMVRHMGGLGQSSDPDAPSYHGDGLPLVDGLVEVITDESSGRGERHEELRMHAGEVAVRSWIGNPADPETETSGVGWILATEWVPYQRSTFVTPAFPGYVSGHSTFSRAAAEVMTSLTGSRFFPGGIAEWTVEAGDLIHEEGPTRDVTIQAATYYDAADQAGMSRVFGGIHPTVDDFNGRRIGSICGTEAWALATTYFDGTATD